MSIEAYRKALRDGKRVWRRCLTQGQSPYLPALEQMLQSANTLSRQSLGTVEIPLDQIAGTYAAGRQPAFTHGFLPLLEENSEFAVKWTRLYQVQQNEGIRDPITAYEFMNQFYVVEGHKRVSVLRQVGAVSVRGAVTRILPPTEDTPESRLYQEFLRFYERTGINYLWFSQEGGFDAILAAAEDVFEPIWSSRDRAVFHGFYAAFRQAFLEKSDGALDLTVGDALLLYLDIYALSTALGKPTAVLYTELSRLWDEIRNRDADLHIHLVLRPTASTPRFPSLSTARLRIAFLHSMDAASSSWTYAHELGRHDLEAAFAGRVETLCLDRIETEQQTVAAIETALSQRCDLIFTTSPRLLGGSVQAALAHPKAKILNCSLNTSHPSIRTYYARMYEAKFLMGAIAGALSADNKVGYIADYPIYGITANINAFALGAKMVNPRAKVYLEWSKTRRADGRARLHQAGISYIADQDTIVPDRTPTRCVGLYHAQENGLSNTALSLWRWGKLYEKLVQSVLRGGWKSDEAGTRAINYWWGMDSGVIDVICSRSLPPETAQLIALLRDAICSGTFRPFSGLLKTQDGVQLDYRQHPITPEEIITMDWLADNVIGALPSFDELLPEAQSLVRIQGILKQ